MTPIPRVLLADDDSVFVATIRTSLGDLGWKIDCCDRGDQALVLAGAGAFDAVIVEPNLPDVIWVRFLQALHARLGVARTFVVTWFGSVAMARESARLGVADFLMKPISAAGVVRAVTGQSSSIAATAQRGPILDECKWEYVNAVLHRCEGNVSEASRRLGIPRQSLCYKLRKSPWTSCLP
jgi:two-component system, response regulator RegA